MNRHLVAAALLLQSGYLIAAPAITSVSGSITDNQTVTIDGSGFGSNNLRVEWLGGSAGPIESLASSVAFLAAPRAGWSEDAALNESRIDTRRAYSGSRSLVFDPNLGRHNDGRFGLIYDTGNNFTELYSSAMYYFEDGSGATEGQWKMIRWCYRNSVTDDAVPNMYISNWEGGPGDFLQQHGGSGASATGWFSGQSLPLAGAWYRVETYVKPSSSASASDGEMWIRTTKTTDGTSGTQRFTGLTTYGSGVSDRFRYIVFQNYMGNGGYNNSTRVWMDDIYVSQTQARVEVCPASTWAQCKKGEIQAPSAWSGTRITVKLNKGAMSSLSGAYLYVVDGSGNANANGYALSGSAPAPVVPAPPTDVQVQ